MVEFQLAKLLYEARVLEGWGKQGPARLERFPWPEHIGAERTAEHDLAIAQARALIASGLVNG